MVRYDADMDDDAGPPTVGAAFLLAQLGAHATTRFAERAGALGLTPPQTGLLRLLATGPGRSQQAVAGVLGVVPSAVVALVDGLEERGLVERRRGRTDRRTSELHLTDGGRAMLGRVAEVARAHEAEVTAALDADERATLVGLLRRVADEQGLTPGVHPGYRNLTGRA